MPRSSLSPAAVPKARPRSVAAPAAAAVTAAATVPDAVFDRLLSDIVRGVHGRGVRLPAERDLVRDLGASRVSVRDALRRLEHWGLISIRHGSGAVVRPRGQWTFDVLPASLREAEAVDGVTAASLIEDALALRRMIVLGMLELAAGRLQHGALAQARATVAQAWRSRTDLDLFAALDFQVTQQVLEAAGMLPAMWLLNKITPAYIESVRAIGRRAAVPSDYVAAHERVFDALEEGDGRRATRLMQKYMEAADRRRLSAWRKR
ncbi:MAG TPA: GntR family transcriptional regulator [Candidatus Limnocylindrales bacterium]|nr:GntR family transcriptional regulator [Candidatus Limnocylindrales bacterium]